MIKEGTIVKGNRNGETGSGVITKTKTHKRKSAAYGRDEVELEITLAEILFQVEGNNRAIYAYTNDEFHIIKDCPHAPAGLEFA